jgi:hypothetical protein
MKTQVLVKTIILSILLGFLAWIVISAIFGIQWPVVPVVFWSGPLFIGLAILYVYFSEWRKEK